MLLKLHNYLENLASTCQCKSFWEILKRIRMIKHNKRCSLILTIFLHNYVKDIPKYYTFSGEKKTLTELRSS